MRNYINYLSLVLLYPLKEFNIILRLLSHDPLSELPHASLPYPTLRGYWERDHHILALILLLSISSPSQVKRLFRMSIRFKPYRNIRKLTLTFNNSLRKTQKLSTYIVAITFFRDVKCAGTASLDHKNTNKNT